MDNFRVGDRVVFSGTVYPINCPAGGRGTVTSINDIKGIIKVKSDGSRDGNRFDTSWSFLKSELGDLTLLANKGENMNKEYKVGDKIDISDMLVKISGGVHHEYANGTKFVVIDNRNNYYGEVVELKNNDNSDCPWFITSRDSNVVFYWSDLAELPKGKATKAAKPAKPSIASTKTIYSDDVEVSETEVRFDGTTHNREALKTLVARYQEILRRPVAAVPAPIVKKKPAAKKTTAKKASK